MSSSRVLGLYKVEEPVPDTLRFRATKESELDMKKI
jgi:hypothetical protein